MIDFQRYAELKKDGGLQIQKIGAKAVIFLRKFHPNTGAEQLPDMGPVDVKQLAQLEGNLSKQLNGIKEFKKDLEDLGVNTDAAKEE